MDDAALLRYSRHLLLDEISVDGQERLLQAKVLIVGAGGLGCAVAAYLGSAGVGGMTLVDHDLVDLTNLQRQILHTTDRIGQPKVASARTQLLAMNPGLAITTVQQQVDADWLKDQAGRHDVLIDCTDNFRTRHAINLASVHAGVPLVSGSAIRFDGQLSVFDPRITTSPCYACLFPADKAPTEARCATMGVLSPLVGVIGSLQAAETIKLITGAGQPMTSRLLMVDLLGGYFETIRCKRKQQCAVCGPATMG